MRFTIEDTPHQQCNCREKAALIALVDAFADKMKSKLIEQLEDGKN